MSSVDILVASSTTIAATEPEDFGFQQPFDEMARALMNAATAQAKKENCSLIWTFPRESSISFYESVGFKRVGEWVDSGEFGPNIYALKTT